MQYFFDFRKAKKAFDSVPHRPLITKLQQMGIPNHLLVWISSYLTNRSQKVVVNSTTSESMPVLSGIPQGSVLFLIYIDGITSIKCEGNLVGSKEIHIMVLTDTVSG